MRKHTIWASATLALILSAAAGCGGSSNPGSSSQTSNCVNPTAAHRAYVMVEHSSMSTIQKCVGFSGDTIDGQSLMDQSGIKYQSQDFGGSLGKAMCSIDNEPAHYDKCFSDSGPWWLLFVETNGQWVQAPTGYAKVTLHNKEALGWVFTAAASPVPPPTPKP